MGIITYENVIDIRKYQGSQGKNKNQGASLRIKYCTEYCVVCPKTTTAIQIGKNVYIKPNVVIIKGKQFQISNPMFRILCAFNEHQGEVLSRAFLLAYAWGPNKTVKNSLTVAMYELRLVLLNTTKLEIVTVRGTGYKMFNTNQGKY
ncbi:winged helix-turn-helix domain-containing protein [Paraglaciecola psychrophila]|jgi:DNA-binding response OmpR family regulator|uniref:winged helix-turn-helix domain-containing protein n=1 Tax=Paraglaciecola psychrophila TaxID=326544 RepID=UPI00029101D2|nr:winged helix-turn-helix domain-containing protein [Paraglaciecola psychrophila]GAC36852.1 hypothetical protein GPSY_1215 [Paraglaciecola psychrophila 170]